MKYIKKFIYVLAVLLSVTGPAYAQEKKAGPDQLFYSGNACYEKRDYARALEDYLKVVGAGVESGNLYYNIGNTYLKLNKPGYAMLYYERAKRLIPHDSDLKSNLAYARSLTGDASAAASEKNIIVRMIERPFSDFSLTKIAILAAIFYFIVILIQALFVFLPAIKSRFVFPFIAAFCAFGFILTAFGIRYYEEKYLEAGVVVQKGVECKYEPIDKSTTYYTLQEGSGIYILKTRNGWRQVRRHDGKVGWVNKETVEVI